MIYYSFFSQSNDSTIYLDFLIEIEEYEKMNKVKLRILNVFSHFLIKKNSQDANYFLMNMIEQNLIDSYILDIIKNTKNKYYILYMLPEESNKLKRYFKKRFNANYEELSKNDFALHKQLVKEGHNPNEIAKIIRNEDLEKLQELSSQTNFDFNQTIPKSLYERCSFINKENVTLIDYAAFFSSVKCFKYLLMNGAKVYYTYEYAIAGGNLEIIHLCAQNKAAFKNLYKTSIEFHRNDIFKYLYENKIYINLKKIGKKCLLYHNYEILSFLLENRMKINNFIMNETARAGNIFLLKHFHKFKQLPKNIFVFASESGNIEIVKYVLGQKEIDIHLKNNDGKTALMIASENGHVDIVKLILEQKDIDINEKTKNGTTALILATENRHAEIVKLLLEQKEIDVNAKRKDDRTSLILASKLGDLEIVKLFLEYKGININNRDTFFFFFAIYLNNFVFLNNFWKLFRLFNTALILASKNKHIKIVKLLLEQKGIDINKKDFIYSNDFGFQNNIWKIFKFFRTALIWSSEYGHTEIVKLLLEQEGIDINAKDLMISK